MQSTERLRPTGYIKRSEQERLLTGYQKALQELKSSSEHQPVRVVTIDDSTYTFMIQVIGSPTNTACEVRGYLKEVKGKNADSSRITTETYYLKCEPNRLKRDLRLFTGYDTDHPLSLLVKPHARIIRDAICDHLDLKHAETRYIATRNPHPVKVA